ncbi:hypothetical protein U0070_010800 [Myodes glareolus]|uniref:Uncharacterized protein n=1 Tax=Myodes glareolus TaxID=447135 RepID=A0AAW0H3A1_MYOGA
MESGGSLEAPLQSNPPPPLLNGTDVSHCDFSPEATRERRFYKVHFSVFLLISIDNPPISSRSCNMINIGIYENDY